MDSVGTGLKIREVEVAEKPMRRRFSVEYKRPVQYGFSLFPRERICV